MIVSTMKTKIMVHGPANKNFSLKFNDKTLYIVDQYNHLDKTRVGLEEFLVPW